jgi:predicted nucleic-acid-binding protein
MIGLDTNVLVRYALRDDEIQASKVDKFIDKCLFEQSIIMISLITIQETEWVLRSKGRLSKTRIIELFKLLLESSDVLIELEEVLEEALLQFENSNADFSDCLMIAKYLQSGCDCMVTFDKNAAKMDGALLLN